MLTIHQATKKLGPQNHFTKSICILTIRKFAINSDPQTDQSTHVNSEKGRACVLYVHLSQTQPSSILSRTARFSEKVCEEEQFCILGRFWARPVYLLEAVKTGKWESMERREERRAKRGDRKGQHDGERQRSAPEEDSGEGIRSPGYYNFRPGPIRHPTVGTGEADRRGTSR